MENAIYATLTRQSGLMREIQVVANNIANLSTTGFRREGVVFSEYVRALPDVPSLSMAWASPRVVDLQPGDLVQTGGTFDMAIEGEGFFLVATPQGDRLTRAGHFTPGPDGTLLNADGYALLDAGGTPVVVPPGTSGFSLARDGTLSADGQPLALVGLWQPQDPLSLRHQQGTLFSADAPEAVPPESGSGIMQGYLENSNVNPVAEIARMTEVQRAYELGQGLLDREDQRIRGVLQTLGR